MDEIDAILKMGPSAEVAEEDEMSTSDAGLDAAADEMLAAVSAGDKTGLKMALKNAFTILFESRGVDSDD